MRQMETYLLSLLILTLFFISGCALYGNEKQYAKGDWYFFAGSEEAARIQQDKLALEKLEAQPVQTAQITKTEGKKYINVELLSKKSTPAEPGQDKKRTVSAGYKGLVVNLSKYNIYNFIISGPERKGYLLGPNETASDYLIPGTYSCAFYQAGRQIGESWIFHVTAQQHNFKGQMYHWYVYME